MGSDRMAQCLSQGGTKVLSSLVLILPDASKQVLCPPPPTGRSEAKWSNLGVSEQTPGNFLLKSKDKKPRSHPVPLSTLATRRLWFTSEAPEPHGCSRSFLLHSHPAGYVASRSSFHLKKRMFWNPCHVWVFMITSLKSFLVSCGISYRKRPTQLRLWGKILLPPWRSSALFFFQ